ncbi:Rv3235 family protein [Haematomicrobium sanguinis]|uniref:Rv3235 family protein n=1 Tax=Haematomicrobium sanguinis TaxID=479106 RepID=UPI00068F8CB3|nr:Rv3235 family protein [Haematomicrobium sanguinis]
MNTALAPATESSAAVPNVQSPYLAREEQHIHKIACAVAVAAIEALAGHRSLAQLTRWLDRETYERVARRASLTVRLNSAGFIRNVHAGAHIQRSQAQRIAPGIYETAVIIAEKTRARAIALRIEQHRGLWKITALDIA